MRHTRALLLLFALFIAAGAHAQGVAQTPATQSPTPAHDAKKDEAKRRYETVAFESKLVGASLPYNVVLPPDYKRGSSKHKRYPVVYLLHGLAGSADDWVSSRSEEHTSELQSRQYLVCRLLLEKKKKKIDSVTVKITL